MTNQQMIMTIIAAMISGIITSTLLLFITTYQTKLQNKRDLIDNIFSYRYQYLQCNRTDLEKGEVDFTREISRIPIVFNDDKKVLNALEHFYEKAESGIRDGAFVILLKQLCISEHFNCRNWNDSRFTKTL